MLRTDTRETPVCYATTTVCPKCGMDMYYKFHYGLDAFTVKRENGCKRNGA